MDKAAVVILNWNGKEFLQKFLPSVVSNSKNEGIKIWVADNGSADDSIKFLEKEYPELGLIKLDKNYGFAGGYNKALKQIDAEYYMILNSDVEVTEGWLIPLIELMDSDKTIAACMPKLKAYNQKENFEYAGAAGGFIDKYGFPFCRGRILDKIEKDTGQFNNRTEIFWATGAAILVRAKLFHEQNGFDEDFFAHMEEIDLCWRLKNADYKIMYEPASVVYHVGGGTLPNNSSFKLYLNFRNSLFMLYKNLSHTELNSILFKRKLFDGLAAVKFLLSLQFGNFMAVAKAHKDFYKSISSLKAKRLQLEDKRKRDKHSQIYPKSLVIAFFVKGKKLFKDFNWQQ